MLTTYSDEIDKAINDINDEIKARFNVGEFMIFVNERYWTQIQKRLKLENIEYKITDLMEKDQVAIIVDKKLFDMRDMYDY